MTDALHALYAAAGLVLHESRVLPSRFLVHRRRYGRRVKPHPPDGGGRDAGKKDVDLLG
jgi:hypothetical protein